MFADSPGKACKDIVGSKMYIMVFLPAAGWGIAGKLKTFRRKLHEDFYG